MKKWLAICLLLCSIFPFVACANIGVSVSSPKTEPTIATDPTEPQSTTIPNTKASTAPTTASVAAPTVVPSEDQTIKPSTVPPTAVPTDPATEEPTTISTTKPTTRATTKVTTKATTKATTKPTTRPTAVPTTSATVPPKTHLSHTEYLNAALYDDVTVQFYVQATQEWWDNKIVVYGQDKNGGGYYAYDMACSKEDAARLVPGTLIRVSGTKSDWQGLIEITNGTFEFVEGDTWVAPVTDVTSLMDTDDLKKEMNKFISIKGMTVTAISFKGDAPGDDIYLDLSYNGADYTFAVERYLTGPDTEVYATVSGLQVGQIINIEGMLSWWKGPYVHITSAAVVHSPQPEDKPLSEEEASELVLEVANRYLTIKHLGVCCGWNSCWRSMSVYLTTEQKEKYSNYGTVEITCCSTVQEVKEHCKKYLSDGFIGHIEEDRFFHDYSGALFYLCDTVNLTLGHVEYNRVILEENTGNKIVAKASLTDMGEICAADRLTIVKQNGKYVLQSIEDANPDDFYPSYVEPGCYTATVGDSTGYFAELNICSDHTWTLAANFELDSISIVEPFTKSGTYEIRNGMIWLYVDGETYWMYWIGSDEVHLSDQCVAFCLSD